MKKVLLTDLVDVVVLYCKANGLRISPLKLQKILYYIQAWHIAKFDKNNLFTELPQAWVNGPVYRSVYDMYKHSFFKSEDIPIDKTENIEDLLEEKIKSLEITKNQKSVINSVLKFYASQDEGNLVLRTHTDKPWNQARKKLSPFERSTNEIKAEWMFDFYSQKLS
ncbi:Panacea domain-containing protein [Aquimarina sp. M1]